MKTLPTILLLLLSFAIKNDLKANLIKDASIFKVLQEKNYTKLTITSNFDEFRANRMKEGRQVALLEFENEAGEKENWDIEIEARGKFRRRTCSDMPPIRFLFSKKELKKQSYDSARRKYKLVTHCLENETSDQSVLKEYWAYKMYNQLTTSSFNVHLLEITYKNIADQSEIQHIGFIIENEKELAKRIGGKEEEKWGLTRDSIQATNYQNVLFFQYMIGNADWELQMIRNLILVAPKNAHKAPTLVPYDFDASGLVNASYAIPNPNFNQTSVKQRIVMDSFKDEESLRQTCERFRSLYEQNWCFDSCTYLTKDSKKEMAKYLKNFMKLISNEKKTKKLFLE